MGNKFFALPTAAFGSDIHGQYGVPGATPSFPLRSLSSGVVYYVDADSSSASDSNVGTNPDAPLATIQAAVDKVTSVTDVISVAPGAYAETVTTPDATTGPNYVTLMGVGDSLRYPTWASSAGTTTSCLIVKATGWRITGFHFTVPTLAAAIVLTNAATPYATTDVASGTVIDNCLFDGAAGVGAIGIDLHGSPANVTIENNIFLGIAASTGTSIAATVVSTAQPAYTRIIGNEFMEGKVYIKIPGTRTIVKDNVLARSRVGSTTTTFIDLRTALATVNLSGSGIVTLNVFDGTYSNAGGYYGNTTNVCFWAGNLMAADPSNPWTRIAPA